MDKKQCICCNHNPNDSDTTLIMLAKRNMIFPPQFDFFCTNCNEVFKFKKDENMIYYIEDSI